MPFNSAEMVIYSQELDNFDLVRIEKEFQEELLVLAKRAEKAREILTYNSLQNTTHMKEITKKEGFVYILVNPAYKNGLVKIGKTVNMSEVRSKQLYKNGGAGVAGEFIVAYEVRVSDCTEVERRVHDLLHKDRWNTEREFFEIPLKKAIDTVYRVVDDLAKQYVIDILPDADTHFTEKQWWANLKLDWKQVFRKHLKIDYEPTETDLLQTVHAIIDYSRDEALRDEVCKFISDANFSKKIKKWYQEKMPKRFKDEFDSFISYQINEKQIRELWDLKKLDCRTSGMPIQSLEPLSQFNKLEELNLQGLKIPSKNFNPLANLKNLKVLNCTETNFADLPILEDLKNLEIIQCHHTKISLENIEAFKVSNCKIESDSFLAPSQAKEPKKKK